MIYVLNGTQLELADLVVLQKTKSNHSHTIFNVSCDFQISKKCRKSYTMEFRNYVKLINSNNGKLPCIFCSRAFKFSGRSNSNAKYKFDDNFFQKIDTKEKAYILGWIASDGHVGKRGVSIGLSSKDKYILEYITSFFDKNIPITDTVRVNESGFITCISNLTINSQKISEDLCKILNIKIGKKSNCIQFPLIEKEFYKYFLRGYFEGDGTINDRFKSHRTYPYSSITSCSYDMILAISKNVNIKNHISKTKVKLGRNVKYIICFCANQTLEFMNFIYGDLSLPMVLERKYNKYIDWKNNYVFYKRKKKV